MSRETADRVSGFFPSTEREYIKSTYNMLERKKSDHASDRITSPPCSDSSQPSKRYFAMHGRYSVTRFKRSFDLHECRKRRTFVMRGD
jgi:hypothetical protein